MARFMHNNLSLRTWLEISQPSLAANYYTLRQVIGPDCCLMAVVKSNAYGHSLVDYAKAVSGLGIDWLGVDSLVEAIKLRDNKIKTPILVLGYTFPDMIDRAIAQNISLLISSQDSLNALTKLPHAGLKIHLKFDTGMSRQGFFPKQAQEIIDFIKQQLPAVIIEGVCTHFAEAKNPAFPKNTLDQIAKFEEVLAVFAKNKLSVLRHASATAGALLFPQARYDLVRIGIGLYGLWPSREVKYALSEKFSLQPILTWKTVIGEIKTLSAGSQVGYDLTEQVSQDTTIAILPVGYWHGYDRSLSSLGRVIINGQRAKVLGRISMDMLVVDISQTPQAQVGQEVILLNGQTGESGFTAEEMADLAATSAYEIITRLNPLIKRYYL